MAGPLPVFAGPGNQRGYGLGGMLSGLFRTAIPFVKRGAASLAKEVGKEALTTGAGILGDVLAGENIKRAAARRTKATGQRMKRRAMAHATSRLQKLGSGQRGRGKRVINRTSRTKTVISSAGRKKRASRPTRGRKGLKIPRGARPRSTPRNSSGSRRIGRSTSGYSASSSSNIPLAALANVRRRLSDHF